MSGRPWQLSPAGQYALDWERAQFDAVLADVFGYHALQLGLGEIDTLAANRMPHRWLALPRARAAQVVAAEPASEDAAPPARRVALLTDSTALPFAEASLDLVTLPHTLELSADPHATLREVQRVLVHEGKVAITGFNPASLWGLRQWRSHLQRHADDGRVFLPEAGDFIGHWRLRDWLRLLEFELESISFGCWRPAARSARGLARFDWMDRLGARWWPVLGATYCLVAVKRTHGAKLVGAAWKTAQVPVGAPASVANRAGATPASAENHLESR